ncbi:protocatechuate 3,4-dioxygenase beta chain-like [Dreissena polymorpha]|uniref:Intradiol ring-cleavage dioxygenases domain-containing protein n=1 Tax=Dreissena polymorpha TaxID=45954 RepID=A0A9D4ECN1_DREPO|nr:protocatechuate 3,4-dioxygenase beta chain-like [Dreissena polymorpha]KAH3775697.1 hypothetical protein DPMN_177102 [Dreissena polymorpha]
MSGTIETSIAGQQETCKPTTSDILGPYYLENAPRTNWICQQRGHSSKKSRDIVVEGRILDENCRPLPKARIEIWQAGADGKYSSKFECRGHLFSDDDGQYAFITVRPGKYTMDDEFRPAHIHYRIVKPLFSTLVTQLYFSGDSSLGEKDACAVCHSGSSDLVTPIMDSCDTLDGGGECCIATAHFDIVLARINGTLADAKVSDKQK